MVAAALLVASGPGTAVNSLYADSDRAGTDTPLAGELGLGDGETVISRIRRLSATVVVLNDNDSPGALDMGVYFQAGGDGNDLTLTVKTATGEVALVVADQLDTSGGNFARLTLPATAQTLFDSIGIGDRWLVRFARPAASGQTHTVDAGDAAWSFDIPEAAVTHTTPQGTAYTVDAGNVSWSFTIPAVTVTLTPAGGVNSVGFTDNSILVIDTFARFDHGTDPDPELPAAWVTAGDPVFDAINVEPGGDIIPDIDPSAGRSSDTIRYVFTFESGGETLIVVHTGDIDDARFTPGNAGAVTAFYNTLVNGAAGTVTISDDPSLQETPNPGGVQHAVDAGDAAWSFAVPEVSVTHTTPTGTGHTVNAGNAAWSFDVPPVTVTFTPRPGVDYTRNAGNASWSFAIPAVTVTHTTALPQDLRRQRWQRVVVVRHSAGQRHAQTPRWRDRLQRGSGRIGRRHRHAPAQGQSQAQTVPRRRVVVVVQGSRPPGQPRAHRARRRRQRDRHGVGHPPFRRPHSARPGQGLFRRRHACESFRHCHGNRATALPPDAIRRRRAECEHGGDRCRATGCTRRHSGNPFYIR